MKRFTPCILLGVLPTSGVCPADNPAIENKSEKTAAAADTTDTSAPQLPKQERTLLKLPFKFGLDYYMGISNIPGERHFSDGLWAGSVTAAPSLAYMSWTDGSGTNMRFSAGIGGMFTGSGSALNQPAEAYWQRESGRMAVTVGKFWVPFGAQEWAYESKPGVMLQWKSGKNAVAFASNYNTETHRTNNYLHFTRAVGSESNVGLSIAGGKGLTYNSLHDAAIGVDATTLLSGFRFSGEYVGAMHGSQGFNFGYGKVACERLGLWKPYVGVYSWNDRSGAFGQFQSAVYGMQYQVNAVMGIDAGIAPTASNRRWWIQLHTSM